MPIHYSPNKIIRGEKVRLDKKGQALIEFILIIPILIMILMVMIDFGQIIYTKTILESEINYIVDEYASKKTPETKIKDVKIDINRNNQNTEIILSKSIKILTPGINLVLDNPYEVIAKRVIKNET